MTTRLVPLTMFLLAAAPTLQVPVIHVAVTVPLVGLCVLSRWVAGSHDRLTRSEIGVGALLLTALVSLLGHRLGYAAWHDYATWAIMSAFVVPLCALPLSELTRAGRAYAWGAGAGAAFGLGLRFGDPGGRLLSSLSVLGYDPTGFNERYVPGADGRSVLRLTGAYLDPNLGGLILTCGLVFAVAFLRGSARIGVTVTVLAAVGMTFSRSAFGAVVVAVVVLTVAGRIGWRARIASWAVLAAGVGVALGVQDIRLRLLDSFGSNDVGSQVRASALRAFPGQMAGQWWLARGFGDPVLTQGPLAIAHADVIPANAVLLTVYRGGIVVGAVFTLVLIVACVQALVLLRSRVRPAMVFGAGMLGLFLFSLQVDVPVVVSAPAVAMLSICLAYLDRATGAAADDPLRAPRAAVPAGDRASAPAEEVARASV